eukprot:TRINITY_DN20165_c0_g1_i1.p1 TRINITY_DN20165_c0_g1~~TRINITY_DN20165_c0_g1_i1.p1  ORF type:complete len:119 (+),score=15.96 TRINITY_DN20165_c0_g1_i1:123-479(+)
MSLLQSLFARRLEESRGLVGVKDTLGEARLQGRRPQKACDLDVTSQDRCTPSLLTPSSLDSTSSSGKAVAVCSGRSLPAGKDSSSPPGESQGAAYMQARADVLARFSHSYERYELLTR